MVFRIIRRSVRFFSNSTRKMMEEPKRSPSLAFWIRPMRMEEIPEIVELTRPYYFHFSPCSLKFWHKQDPDGLAIAVNESGEIIGALFTVKNTEDLFVGGLFCVHGNYRHAEVGRKLLQEGIAHSENKNLIANVDVHQIKPTARRGFRVLETDWKSIEYEIDTPLNPSILSDELPRGVEILPFQNNLLPAIFEYDFSLGGYERKPIIEASCHEENCKTLVAMKDGKCIGFGSIKLDNVEYGRIAPLYADDSSVAEAMVKKLITSMPEAKGFAIVTINTNIFAGMLPEKFSIPVHNSYYRLYTKEKLPIDTKRVFAHLDIEFTLF